MQQLSSRHGGRTLKETASLVCDIVFEGAKTPHRYYVQDMITAGRFLPSGRMFATLNPAKGTFLPNCSVLPVDDSATIARYLSNTIGVGVSMEHCLALDEMYDTMAFLHEHAEDGCDSTGRKPGVMVTMPWSHPLRDPFALSKATPSLANMLSNMNISLVVHPESTAFLRDLKQTPALLGAIRRTGDPGFLFHPSPGVATAPCGEVFLTPYEVCSLGTLCLPRYMSGPTTDWFLLECDAHYATDFLHRAYDYYDWDILGEDAYAVNMTRRRTGLGVMGFASFLQAMDVAYGSGPSVELAHSISIIMAEKAHATNPNAPSVLAFPPTGGWATHFNTSYSVEPMEPLACPDKEVDITRAFHAGIHLLGHQHECGVSKTYVLQEGSSCSAVFDVVEEAFKQGVSGATVYVAGSR